MADDYEVLISPAAEFSQAPTRLRIAAGIYNYFEAGRPGRPALNAAGDPVEPIIATARLIPWQWPQPSRSPATINFFDKATLLSTQLAADQQSITFNWQANNQFEADYTVFIQAWRLDPLSSRPETGGQESGSDPLPARGEYVAGFDGPPVQGDYPTSLWRPGEIIIDTHPLDLTALAPGAYHLVAGLYNPETGERLPAFNANGPLPDYAVQVGELRVTE